MPMTDRGRALWEGGLGHCPGPGREVRSSYSYRRHHRILALFCGLLVCRQQALPQNSWQRGLCLWPIRRHGVVPSASMRGGSSPTQRVEAAYLSSWQTELARAIAREALP